MVVVLVFFSTIRLFFPPFNDDLGTMPTRRPYSWKKKAKREKQNMVKYICPADKCEQLDKPKWLRFLPPSSKDQWGETFKKPHPGLATL